MQGGLVCGQFDAVSDDASWPAFFRWPAYADVFERLALV